MAAISHLGLIVRSLSAWGHNNLILISLDSEVCLYDVIIVSVTSLDSKVCLYDVIIVTDVIGQWSVSMTSSL